MPVLNAVLETSLYVAEIGRARSFFEAVLGLTPMVAEPHFCAYGLGAGSVLLLFRQGSTRETVTLPGGTIPSHGAEGPGHVAFAVQASELAAWETRLAEAGIAIEARMRWPRGGQSLYFRDPDRNLLELATPGLWPNY